MISLPRTQARSKMPERPRTGERGIHRVSTVFFSERDRLTPYHDLSAAHPHLKDRMRESASQQRAVSFLIVDTRLLASRSHLLSLFPRELSERLTLRDRISGVHADTWIESLRRHPLRGWLPLLTGAAAAAAGFWIFFHLAL